MSFTSSGRVTTSLLEIGYEQAGDPAGPPVILLHGFPYDVRAFDGVASILADCGAFALAPYLRGFGPTRFLDDTTIRSGQQAALAQDLVDFMDALNVERAVVAGYDWGGRAACIAAALRPDRVAGLVSVDGYNVQHLAHAGEPAPPEWERTYWYQYYFHSERGRRGLDRNRDALCELLWRTWSPTWRGASEAFAASAPSLHNPDFVDVVIHSYRHRYGLADGDPRYQGLEDLIAEEPPITIPTIVLEGGSDGVGGPGASEDRGHFTGPYTHRTLPGVGHNPPQENPEAFAQAVLDLLASAPPGPRSAGLGSLWGLGTTVIEPHPERDLAALLGSLSPQLREGEWVFVSAPAVPESVRPRALLVEDEGVSMLLERSEADVAGLPYDFVAAWITLRVHSALDAVGLTAAVAARLAAAGISCNVIAACFHDHLLVPHHQAAQALAELEQLGAAGRPG